MSDNLFSSDIPTALSFSSDSHSSLERNTFKIEDTVIHNSKIIDHIFSELLLSTIRNSYIEIIDFVT